MVLNAATRSRSAARSITLAIAAAALLAACENPLAEMVEALQAETVSPRISVLRGTTELDGQTGIDLGTIAFGQTLDVVLTIGNSGKSGLTISEDAIRFEPDDQTGDDLLTIVSRPDSVDIGGTAALTFRVTGTAAGTKGCVLVIDSNDVTTPSFRLSISFVVSELSLPDVPDGLRIDNLGTAPAMYTCLLLSWSAVDSAKLGYVICRDTVSEGNYDTRFNYAPTTNSGTITYTDTTGVPGQTYYYKVVSRNSLGTSSLNASETRVGALEGTPVTGVELSANSLVLSKGATAALTATLSPAGASIQTVAWTSDAPNSVSVDADGNITAADYGRATITARSEDNSGSAATCVVDVQPERPNLRLNGVAVDSGSTQVLTSVPASLSMTTVPATAIIRYTMDGTTPDVDSDVFDPSAPINIAGSGLDLSFKAAAFDSNGVSSPVATVTVQVRQTGLTSALTASSTVTTFNWEYNEGYMLPMGMTSDGTHIFIADNTRRVIWKVDPASGEESVFAGKLDTSVQLLDGIGESARFRYPNGLTTDGTYLYLTDSASIRRIRISTAEVETLAGASTGGYADGIGASARFSVEMKDITTNGRYLFVVDKMDDLNSYIRRLDLFSSTFDVQTITTIPHYGNGIASDGTYLYISASMSASDARGVIWQCGYSASPLGTIAGNGLADLGSVDGTGTGATFNAPWALVCDGPNLYILEHGGLLLRKMVISTKVVSTVQDASLTTRWTNGMAIQGNALYYMKRPDEYSAYLMQHQ